MTQYLDGERREWMSERLVPSEELANLGAPAGTRLRVVATEGSIDDWAAYAHFEKYDAGYVSREGHKLAAASASRIFPLFDIKRYRS